MSGKDFQPREEGQEGIACATCPSFRDKYGMKSGNKSEHNAARLSGLFSPFGRIGRRYFVRYMALFIVCFYLSGLLGGVLVRLHAAMGMLLTVAMALLLILLMLGQTVRRYHDFGCTGWVPGSFVAATLFLAILDNWPSRPLLQIFPASTLEMITMAWSALSIVVLFFVPALWPGTKGANRYGG